MFNVIKMDAITSGNRFDLPHDVQRRDLSAELFRAWKVVKRQRIARVHGTT